MKAHLAICIHMLGVSRVYLMLAYKLDCNYCEIWTVFANLVTYHKTSYFQRSFIFNILKSTISLRIKVFENN